MSRDDAMDDGEPQPCALAYFLSSEEWLEDARLRFLIHPRSSIGDR